MYGEMHTKFVRKPEGRDHLQDIGGNEWVVLTWIFNRNIMSVYTNSVVVDF
jgi:hypothetical protein